MKKGKIFSVLILGMLMAAGCGRNDSEMLSEKPVIYLYPERAEEVSVRLDYKGDIICTYPEYEDGWHVIARPDGTLQNLRDGKEYSYLFWEGVDKAQYDWSRGFVVRGEDTAEFLQEKLEQLGLTAAESNEFIVYWLPRMERNEWNLITFQTEAYTSQAALQIEPAPDSVIRVFMAYTELKEPIDIPEQELISPERTGFTVVEWGGAEIK